MLVTDFVEQIKKIGIKTLAGVPDSALKSFCDYINGTGKNEFEHYVPVNEGAAVGIAIGSYLATGVPACVYMQNSGLGNIVNPITSLANKDVYGIPMLLLVGWRGEPGTKDEPQHKYMGKITEDLLRVLEIEYIVLEKELSMQEIMRSFERAAHKLEKKRVYCLDGDGAVLMHMGSMAYIAKQKPQNLIHICLNNDAHESVGGMPTGCVGLSYADIAGTVGYERVYCVDKQQDLTKVLSDIKKKRNLTFIEIKVAMQSRADLGRPKETAEENKNNFMKYHGVGL